MKIDVSKLNTEVKAECERLCSGRDWDVSSWSSHDSAIVIVRALAKIAGDMDLLADDPDSKKERVARVEAILPLLDCGAPINFQRGWLTALKLVPEKSATAKADKNALA